MEIFYREWNSSLFSAFLFVPELRMEIRQEQELVLTLSFYTYTYIFSFAFSFFPSSPLPSPLFL